MELIQIRTLGEFSLQSSEIRVIPICTHFQNRFSRISQEAVALLPIPRKTETCP